MNIRRKRNTGLRNGVRRNAVQIKKGVGSYGKRGLAGIVPAVGLCLCLCFSGCGKKTEPEPAPNPPQPETVWEDTLTDPEPAVQDPKAEDTVSEEETHEGQAKSFLTGEWIDQEVAAQRPVSCMIGNTESALPQFGIGQAQVIYEAPVEGGLTRLMGIFEDYQHIRQLGSVRSSRLYYAYYSMGFDAVYLHYGQASYAQGFLESGQIDDLNGMEYEVDAAVIYRDQSKKAPHNAYATGEGLARGIALKQYDTQHAADYKGTFRFAEDGSPVKLKGASSRKAGAVQPGYLVNKPYFVYEKKDGLYYRYQYGGRQIDGADGNQLAVKNIILQHATVRVLDENGYLEVQTTGSGSGWYLTNGAAQEITWECTDAFSPARYYDGSGKEITLNQGKTWICVVDQSALERVRILEDASNLQ